MNHYFRKILWQLRIEPISQLMLMGYAVFLVLMVVTLDGTYLILCLSWVLLFTILGRTANNGHPASLATVLTPNFYAVRALNGRRSIFQRRRGKGGPADRRAALKELVAEQTLLPAALKPGRYQAITHDTVLRRLRALPNVSEVAVVPAYRAVLKSPRGKGEGKLVFCRQEKQEKILFSEVHDYSNDIERDPKYPAPNNCSVLLSYCYKQTVKFNNFLQQTCLAIGFQQK